MYDDLRPEWACLDLEAAKERPDLTRWEGEGGQVARWGGDRPVVHAVEVRAFGPTTRLLAARIADLPRRLELRCGPGAAGVLARRFELEMIGPFVRLVAPGLPGGPEPLAPTAIAARIRDAESALEAVSGWVLSGPAGAPVAACGVAERSAGVVALTAPRLDRRARSPVFVREIVDAARRGSERAVVDVRVDRADRIAWIEAAGFVRVGMYERWWAEAR